MLVGAQPLQTVVEEHAVTDGDQEQNRDQDFDRHA
jgi:hypothetical protein